MSEGIFNFVPSLLNFVEQKAWPRAICIKLKKNKIKTTTAWKVWGSILMKIKIHPFGQNWKYVTFKICISLITSTNAFRQNTIVTIFTFIKKNWCFPTFIRHSKKATRRLLLFGHVLRRFCSFVQDMGHDTGISSTYRST